MQTAPKSQTETSTTRRPTQGTLSPCHHKSCRPDATAKQHSRFCFTSNAAAHYDIFQPSTVSNAYSYQGKEQLRESESRGSTCCRSRDFLLHAELADITGNQGAVKESQRICMIPTNVKNSIIYRFIMRLW